MDGGPSTAIRRSALQISLVAQRFVQQIVELPEATRAVAQRAPLLWLRTSASAALPQGGQSLCRCSYLCLLPISLLLWTYRATTSSLLLRLSVGRRNYISLTSKVVF